MEGLTEGRIVHFVFEDPGYGLVHRPAMVVRVWNKDDGYVNLMVFPDGSNDRALARETVPCELPVWITSIRYSEEPKALTWHWIEKA